MDTEFNSTKVASNVRARFGWRAGYLIAGIGIVVFITLFASHHKWDQNELHYQELMAKKGEAVQQLNEN